MIKLTGVRMSADDDCFYRLLDVYWLLGQFDGLAVSFDDEERRRLLECEEARAEMKALAVKRREAADEAERKRREADGDEDILRLWRESCPTLQEWWPADDDVTTWMGVEFGEEEEDAGRVVKIDVHGKLGDAVEVPAAPRSATIR
jgi:hypothetical protein